MDFRILGPIEVTNEGQPLRLGGPRQRALLAYLLLREGEVVQGSRLVDELWHEPPSGGVAALQSQMSRLRRIVGDRISTAGAGYSLRLAEDDEYDLRSFQALLVKAGLAVDPADRAELLTEAERLWHGTPFDGLDVPFVATETVALEELRIAAIEERLEAELEAGHDGDLVPELSKLIARYPLRERLRRQWILALYRSGRQADALEAHRETRRMFDDELGLELSPALAELERAILRHDPSLDAPRERAAVHEQPARRRRPAALAALLAVGAVVTVAGVALAFEIAAGDDARTPTTTAAARIVPVVHDTHVRHVAHVVPRHVRPVQRPARPAAKRRELVATPTTPPASTPTVTVATTTVAVVSTPRVTTSTPVKSKRKPTTKPAAVPPTTTAPKVESTPAPKPKTIADDFNGTSIDPLIWYQVGEGNGWTMDEQNGHLEFSFQPGTTSDPRDGVYGGHVATLCKFPRDFDARVDYSLAAWPAGNRMSVLMWAFLGPKPLPWSVSRSSMSTETYDANFGSYVNVVDSDVAGALRIARHGSAVTAYFLHNGGWVTLASATNASTAAIGIGVLGGEAKGTPFNGQPVTVDFDNFKVSGVHPLCPPGSPLG